MKPILQAVSPKPDQSPSMDNRTRRDVIQCARDGEPVHHLADRITDSHLDDLSERKAELLEERADIENGSQTVAMPSSDEIRTKADATVSQIDAEAYGSVLEIEAKSKEVSKGESENRAFLLRRNLHPGPPEGYNLLTLFFVGLFAMADGLVTGAVFYQAGVVPTISAGITIGIMAALSIAFWACYVGGHLVGRFFNLGSGGGAPDLGGDSSQVACPSRCTAGDHSGCVHSWFARGGAG